MPLITKRVTSLNESNDCVCSENYEKVNVFTWHEKDSPYYKLSPYFLKTDGKECINNNGNVLFENFWQGSKVYPIVYPIDVYPHFSLKGNSKYLSWSWKTTNKHFIDDKVQDSYYEWRQSIYDCPKAIRYPNGFNNRTKCLFALVGNKRLNYIESRKEIYVKEYSRLIRNTEIYKILLQKLIENKNICIVEIDVPSFNKDGIWKTDDNNNIFKPTLETLKLLLDDPKYPFGHGLVLSLCLLEDYTKK